MNGGRRLVEIDDDIINMFDADAEADSIAVETGAKGEGLAAHGPTSKALGAPHPDLGHGGTDSPNRAGSTPCITGLAAGIGAHCADARRILGCS